MKIYTKTGDDLTTSIIKERVDKDHYIVEANGTIDELMASLMIAYHYNEDGNVKKNLVDISKDLFIVSSDIILGSNKLINEKVKKLEELIDTYDSKLTPLTDFILPGSNLPSSYLHLSRTICRRAERRVVSVAKVSYVNDNILQYLNRLSDLLFVLARVSELGVTYG